MIWRSFYSNETVKCSWSDCPSSSRDVVRVFMSSFMLKTLRASRASVCMCAVNETARLCHSLTEMQNMQDSYLNSASRFKCTDLLLINSSKLRHIPRHSALYDKFHYMTAFRDSARIFRIADIIVDCDLLQLQQRLLLPYLWETTDAWSLRQLQLACAFGVRLPSVFRDSWLPTYQMSGGRRLLSEIERSPHSHRVLSSDRLHRAK